MKDMKEKYTAYLEAAEKRISDYLTIKEPVSIYEPFKYIMSAGGKRIRPVLTLLSAAAAGGDPDKALNSAAAIEILHNFTLVHDDIMDESPFRRGKPTVHKKWNEAAGILTGDVMVGCAYRLLPKPSEHSRAEQINEAFTDALIVVCEGQAFDMDFNNSSEIQTGDYLKMISMKTAKLLETCAVIGAMTAEADDNTTEALRDYAHNLGMAFQLQDDLLDITAEQAKLGKQIGQDIIEGKKTFLILKAKEAAKQPADISLLEEFYRNNGLGKEYISAFQKMFQRLNIYKITQQEIEKYLHLAEQSLEQIPPSEDKETLLWLLQKLNNRSY